METRSITHLINEGREAVVQSLDLLLLLSANTLDGGVKVKLHGGQQGLVHRDIGDGRAHAREPTTTTTTHNQATCSIPAAAAVQ